MKLKDAAGGTGGKRPAPKGGIKGHTNTIASRNAGGTRKPKPKRTSQNASSAAGGMSKAVKKGYAQRTKANSNMVAQNRKNARNTRRQNRAAGSGGGSNPIDSLGKGIRDFFGSVVPQDILMNQNTNAIRRATRRK